MNNKDVISNRILLSALCFISLGLICAWLLSNNEFSLWSFIFGIGFFFWYRERKSRTSNKNFRKKRIQLISAFVIITLFITFILQEEIIIFSSYLNIEQRGVFRGNSIVTFLMIFVSIIADILSYKIYEVDQDSISEYNIEFSSPESSSTELYPKLVFGGFAAVISTGAALSLLYGFIGLIFAILSPIFGFILSFKLGIFKMDSLGNLAETEKLPIWLETLLGIILGLIALIMVIMSDLMNINQHDWALYGLTALSMLGGVLITPMIFRH